MSNDIDLTEVDAATRQAVAELIEKRRRESAAAQAAAVDRAAITHVITSEGTKFEPDNVVRVSNGFTERQGVVEGPAATLPDGTTVGYSVRFGNLKCTAYLDWFAWEAPARNGEEGSKKGEGKSG